MERKIEVNVSPEDQGVRVDVVGVSDITSHKYDNIEAAEEGVRKRLNFHEAAMWFSLTSGLEMLALGTGLIQKGFDNNDPLLSTVGGALAVTGTAVLVEHLPAGSDRRKEMEQELNQLKEISQNQNR